MQESPREGALARLADPSVPSQVCWACQPPFVAEDSAPRGGGKGRVAERGLFVTGDPWSPECGQGASPTCVLMERQLDPSDPPTARGLQGVPGSVSRPPRPTLAHIPAALLQWGPTPLPAPFPRPLHGDSGTLGHHGAHEPLGWAPSSTLARSLMRASPLAWGQQPAPCEIRRVAGTPHV